MTNMKREDWIGIDRPGTTELIKVMTERGVYDKRAQAQEGVKK